MTSLAGPAPIAVEHAGHVGPLLACHVCRRRANDVAFRRRYRLLRLGR